MTYPEIVFGNFRLVKDENSDYWKIFFIDRNTSLKLTIMENEEKQYKVDLPSSDPVIFSDSVKLIQMVSELYDLFKVLFLKESELAAEEIKEKDVRNIEELVEISDLVLGFRSPNGFVDLSVDMGSIFKSEDTNDIEDFLWDILNGFCEDTKRNIGKHNAELMVSTYSRKGQHLDEYQKDNLEKAKRVLQKFAEQEKAKTSKDVIEPETQKSEEKPEQDLQSGLELIQLEGLVIPDDIIAKVHISVAKTYQIVPVRMENGSLVVAIADKIDEATLRDLMSHLNCVVK